MFLMNSHESSHELTGRIHAEPASGARSPVVRGQGLPDWWDICLEGVNHRKTTGKPQENQGKPWENHGKTIGKPWENHGETIGKPWETIGKT